MTKLPETYIHIKVDANKNKLYELKEYLAYAAAISARANFNFEVEIEIIVKEGSIKGWLKVAGYLYLGVAAY